MLKIYVLKQNQIKTQSTLGKSFHDVRGKLCRNWNLVTVSNDLAQNVSLLIFPTARTVCAICFYNVVSTFPRFVSVPHFPHITNWPLCGSKQNREGIVAYGRKWNLMKMIDYEGCTMCRCVMMHVFAFTSFEISALVTCRLVAIKTYLSFGDCILVRLILTAFFSRQMMYNFNICEYYVGRLKIDRTIFLTPIPVGWHKQNMCWNETKRKSIAVRIFVVVIIEIRCWAGKRQRQNRV